MAKHVLVAWNDVEPGETERVDGDCRGGVEHKESGEDGALFGDFVFAVPSAAVTSDGGLIGGGVALRSFASLRMTRLRKWSREESHHRVRREHRD